MSPSSRTPALPSRLDPDSCPASSPSLQSVIDLPSRLRFKLDRTVRGPTPTKKAGDSLLTPAVPTLTAELIVARDSVVPSSSNEQLPSKIRFKLQKQSTRSSSPFEASSPPRGASSPLFLFNNRRQPPRGSSPALPSSPTRPSRDFSSSHPDTVTLPGGTTPHLTLRPRSRIVFGRAPKLDSNTSHEAGSTTLVQLPSCALNVSRSHASVSLTSSDRGQASLEIRVLGQNGIIFEGRRHAQGRVISLVVADGKELGLDFHGFAVILVVDFGHDREDSMTQDEAPGIHADHSGSGDIFDDFEDDDSDVEAAMIVHREQEDSASDGEADKVGRVSSPPVQQPTSIPRSSSEPPTPSKARFAARPCSPTSCPSSPVLKPANRIARKRKRIDSSSSCDSVLSSLPSSPARSSLPPTPSRRTIQGDLDLFSDPIISLSKQHDLSGVIASSIVFQPRATLHTTEVIREVLASQRAFAEVVREGQDAVVAWRSILERALREGPFGVISNKGLKNAAGQPLEPAWYYIPENDDDEERKASLQPFVKPVRGAQKSAKQYFFKKPSMKRRKW